MANGKDLSKNKQPGESEVIETRLKGLKRRIKEYEKSGCEVEEVWCVYAQAEGAYAKGKEEEALGFIKEAFEILYRERGIYKSAQTWFYIRVILGTIIFGSLAVFLGYIAEKKVDPKELLLHVVPILLAFWGVIGSIAAILWSIYRRIPGKDYGWDRFTMSFPRLILGALFAVFSFFLVLLGLTKISEPVDKAISAARLFPEYREAVEEAERREADYDQKRSELDKVLTEQELTAVSAEGTEVAPQAKKEIVKLQKDTAEKASALAETQKEVAKWDAVFPSAKIDGEIAALNKEIEGLETQKEEKRKEIFARIEEGLTARKALADPKIVEEKRIKILKAEKRINELKVERAKTRQSEITISPRRRLITPEQVRPYNAKTLKRHGEPIARAPTEEGIPEVDIKGRTKEIQDKKARLTAEIEKLEAAKKEQEKGLEEILEGHVEAGVSDEEVRELTEEMKELDNQIKQNLSQKEEKTEELNEARAKENEEAEKPPWKDPWFILMAIVAGFVIDFIPSKLETLARRMSGNE